MKLTVKWIGVLALALSWYLGNSLGWVLFHGMLGWHYLAYIAVVFLGVPRELAFFFILGVSFVVGESKLEFKPLKDDFGNSIKGER